MYVQMPLIAAALLLGAGPAMAQSVYEVRSVVEGMKQDGWALAMGKGCYKISADQAQVVGNRIEDALRRFPNEQSKSLARALITDGRQRAERELADGKVTACQRWAGSDLDRLDQLNRQELPAADQRWMSTMLEEVR